MTRSAKAASRLLLLLGIALSGAGGAAAATPRQSGPTTTPPPSISHLNNPSGHYTQDADGTVHARVYLAPIGLSPDPTQDTWRLCTSSLSTIAGTDAISVTGLPFALAVQQANPSADLTAEDGTNLQLSVQTPGTSLQPSAAIVSGTTALTYSTSLANGPSSPVSAVALQPRFDGLDAKVVLANANSAAPAILTLRTDAAQDVSAAQNADGSIVVSHTQQVCGHYGCRTQHAPAFYILPPTIEQGNGPATTAGPLVSLSLSSGSGSSSITLMINAAAFAQSAPTFPLTVDIPVETAEARAQSGTFATVSNCALTSPVLSAAVLVGTNGSCQDRAVLYFDIQQLMGLEQFPITGATLYLYTPQVSGPTGVTVSPNAPGMSLPPPPSPRPLPTTPPMANNTPNPPVPDLPQPPAIQSHPQLTWSTTPAIESGAVGAQATTDTGHWHMWDITSDVRNWAARNQTNSGLTLEGSGLPVQFASPFDPSNTDLSTTPYLDVTLTKPQASQPGATPNASGICTTNCSYNDGAIYPVGVNGEAAFDPAHPTQVDATTNNLMQLAADSLNVGLYRFSAQVNTGTAEAPIYSTTMPCTDQYNSMYEWQGVYQLMQAAYASHVIPVVVFQQDPTKCFVGNTETTDWFGVLNWLAFAMPNFGNVCIGVNVLQYCTTNPPMYFEIGNEPDVPSGSTYANEWESLYPSDFYNGAQGLYSYLDNGNNGGGHPAYSNFHILTAGVESPDDGQCDNQNVSYMQISLYDAAYYGTFPVPEQFLGTSVHPYSYMTNEQETGYWKNAGNWRTNTVCTNLSYMVNTWRIDMNAVLTTQPQSPLVISEANFASINCMDESSTTTHEGAYLMDLYTWLQDHYGYALWKAYPIRTIWFQEMDDLARSCNGNPPTPEYLGLFKSGAGNGNPFLFSKTFFSPIYGLFGPTYFTCPNWYPGTGSWNSHLDVLFNLMSVGSCY